MEWHVWNVVKGGAGSYDVLSGMRGAIVHAQVCMYVCLGIQQMNVNDTTGHSISQCTCNREKQTHVVVNEKSYAMSEGPCHSDMACIRLEPRRSGIKLIEGAVQTHANTDRRTFTKFKGNHLQPNEEPFKDSCKPNSKSFIKGC